MLPHSAPSAAGVDARGILDFLDAFESIPSTRPHGLVMLRAGSVIAWGNWAPFASDRVQLLYSLSKSFTATAAGLAWQDGLLDLDATVLSYFPEYDADIRDPRSRAMTVRHIASMASGHTGETLDLAAAADPTDLVRGFLLVPPDEEPGTVFAYNQPCTLTLAAIIQRRTGRSLIDVLRPRVFDPLGIGEAVWMQRPPHGDLGFSGLFATTDAVARLGELHRRRGMWGDRRILPEAWVDEATRPHIPTPPGSGPDWAQGYGFQFWMSRHGFRGDGAFGQFCVVVPEHELVVAITSETERMQQVLDALWTHVLPALDRAASPDADAELARRLRDLRLPTLDAQPTPDDDWAGRTFRVAPAPGSVADAVTVTRDGAGWTMELSTEAGPCTVPFATGDWAVATAQVPLAANGGWTDAGDLVVELVLLETPHSARITCTPAGTAEARWVTTPLRAPRILDQQRP